jgi:adenosylmethionine-8-amino-7-oxononanoate aminotransferase
VSADAVRELGALGVLTVADTYKGEPVFCGLSVETFAQSADRELLARAERDGKTMTADRAAAYMKIRRADFDHLRRAGLVAASRWTRSGYRSRSYGADCALFRRGDLDALLDRPEYDWAAVRATPKGQRSPLAALPTAGEC